MGDRTNWKPKTMFTGDCPYVLRGMNSGSVDLVYLDPPFNSNANYAAPIGSQAAGAAFSDTWSLSDVDAEWIDLLEAKHPWLWRVLRAVQLASDRAYLVYMATRMVEIRRVLKPRGSIYLHCDPTMSHYLKLSMDAIFGRENFLNEIVWSYGLGGSSPRYFSRKHDIILFYANGSGHTFHKPRVPATSNLMRGRTKGATDVWDIPTINNMAKERTGYPTQKPLALLQRIVTASSDPGEMVLDPFCGCATTCVAADGLGRNWTGIDVSAKAAELVVSRIKEVQGAAFRDVVHRTDVPRRTDLGPLPRYNCTENRQELYGAQGGDCAACGTHFQARHLEVDHIIARANGGTDHIENLQLLCSSCNRIKGSRGMTYLRERLHLY